MMKKTFKVFLLGAFLWLGISPPTAGARTQEPSSTAAMVCGAEQVDYGSGLVAHRLPLDVQKKVEDLSRCLQKEHAELFLDRKRIDPSPPHVSLIYGVELQDIERLKKALEPSIAAKSGHTLSFGETSYWDDRARQKTTLVVGVHDPNSFLQNLHDHMRPQTRKSSFGFHAHVSIGHLHYMSRVSFDTCQQELGQLKAASWSACDFYMTNRCGQPVWEHLCP